MSSNDLTLLGTSTREPTSFNAEIRGHEPRVSGVGNAMQGELEEMQEIEVVEVEEKAETMRYKKFQALSEIHRKRLMEMLNEERQLRSENERKVKRKWREIMRKLKTKELHNQTEILVQQMASQFERHDNLIDLAQQDIMDLEEQFRTAQRSHLRKMDELFDLNEDAITHVHRQWEGDIETIKKEFNSERNQIIEQQKVQMHRMETTYKEVENQLQDKQEHLRHAHDTEREEIRNKNLEEFNVVKITLEGRLEKKEKGFDEEHGRYMELTEDKTREYIELKSEDKRLAKEIDTLMRKNSDLQSQVNHWKKKLSNHVKECKTRNAALRQEKEKMSSHYRELKSEMTKFRRSENERLSEMTMLARQAVKTNTKYLDDLCAILRTAEICRKLETEKEKVCKIHELERINIENDTQDARGDMMLFEPFWKKYNKVLLDKMVLAQQKERLVEENKKAMFLLSQFENGMTVTSDCLDSAENSLFILNGRLEPAAPKDQNKGLTTVEGNQIVNSINLQFSGER